MHVLSSRAITFYINADWKETFKRAQSLTDYRKYSRRCMSPPTGEDPQGDRGDPSPTKSRKG